MKRLRRFFFPPLDSSRMRRLLPLGVLVALPVVFVVATIPAWDYSNSPSFCGKTCHTMPPEYATYLVSPHARVLCVDCHIGRGPFFQQLTRKSVHLRLIYDTITHNYEFPIMASELRPARETCERCHYPAKFSDDSLRVIHEFSNGADNDPYDIYLLMHTGGGSQREGLGKGIHWHTENKIDYIALDDTEQEIPWIRVQTVDGKTVDYVAENSTLDLEHLDQYKTREMDCITCHNRITHLINKPTRAVDTALYRGDLPADIPFIRERAVELLSVSYPSSEAAKEAFAGLDGYYGTNYPDFYAQNREKLGSAITLLEQLYDQSNYPEQELNWQTHPNNIGHLDSAGCFRCHDGRHFSADGEAIRLECNLCHSIPQVVKPGEFEPTMPLATGIEPSSHLSTTWITEHYNHFDAACADCHTVSDPGATTNTSFCSNSICHGVDWKYAGFDAPTLALDIGIGPVATEEALPETAAGQPVTYAALQPVLEKACGRCHGETATKGLQVTEYATLMAGGEDGPVIVPGSPDESLIVQMLTKGHFGKLSDDEMALLEEWIAAGAPEGEAAPAEATATPPAATEETQAVTYAALQPVLEKACGRCHGETATKGLQVTEYATLMAGGEDGPVIVAGSPEESLIVQMLTKGHFGKLSEEEMALLEEWIAVGAPEGEAAPVEATAAPPVATEETQAVTYAALQPVLEKACGRCHGETATKGLQVTEYATLMAGGEDGPVIVAGSPEESLIVQVLTKGHFGKLSDDEMALLEEWIAAGAPEGEPAAASDRE